MKFNEIINESLITKGQLLEQLIKVFLKDSKFLKEDAVEVYSMIFGNKELFESVYEDGDILTEGFQLNERNLPVVSSNRRANDEAKLNALANRPIPSSADIQASLARQADRFEKASSSVYRGTAAFDAGEVRAGMMDKTSSVYRGTAAFDAGEVRADIANAVGVKPSFIKQGTVAEYIRAKKDNLTNVEITKKILPDIVKDTGIDASIIKPKLHTFVRTNELPASALSDLATSGDVAGGVGAAASAATQAAGTAATQAAGHAASATQAAATGVAKTGFFAKLLAGIKGLGTGLAAKLQAWSNAPGIGGWLKTLLSKGSVFMAANPIAGLVIPLVAAVGSVFAAKKIINKIREKKGMKALSTNQVKSMQQMVQEKQDEIDRLRSQMKK